MCLHKKTLLNIEADKLRNPEEKRIQNVVEDLDDFKIIEDEDVNFELKDQCCICFDRKVQEILECCHAFCSECMKEWFVEKDKKICP